MLNATGHINCIQDGGFFNAHFLISQANISQARKNDLIAC